MGKAGGFTGFHAQPSQHKTVYTTPCMWYIACHTSNYWVNIIYNGIPNQQYRKTQQMIPSRTKKHKPPQSSFFQCHNGLDGLSAVELEGKSRDNTEVKIDFHSFHFSGDKRTELHDPGSGLLYSRQTQECLEAQTRVKVVMSF